MPNQEQEQEQGGEALPPVTPKNKKAEKKKHGDLENVLLTDGELGKLKTKFNGTFSDRIERLSLYVDSTGMKYNSHYATILSWAQEDRALGKLGAAAVQ